MERIISVHEYVLKPDAEAARFEAAVRRAEAAGWLEVPGLIAHYFLKGIRGYREGAYAMIWIYENQEAWARIWGPAEHPVSKKQYPANWIRWEEEVLAPFLSALPEKIRFTSYRQLPGFE